jgi:hypothetical protein
MITQRNALSWKPIFWIVAGLSVFVKLILAAVIPLTGDEAYYVMWGKYPALGYYDQPPMIGWWMTVMRFFGTSPVILRLPVILLSPALALIIVDLLKRAGGDLKTSHRAFLGGALFLIAPIHFLLPILSTDAPLILFSVLCFYFFYRAIEEDRSLWATFAGMFFGLAFLSKYFVVLLGLSFLVFAVLDLRNQKVWKMGMICILAALPFFALHLYWNASHCWVNFVFNISGRNVAETYHLEKLKEFFKFQLALIGPVALYFLIRSRKAVSAAFKSLHRNPLERLAVVSFLIPILIFGLSAFKFRQGLHWTLSFYPYFYIVLATVLPEADLKSTFRWTAVLTGAATTWVILVLGLPVETWKNHAFYPGLKMYLAAPRLSRVLESYQKDYILSADGYTEAALLEASSGARVHVFGEGVLFGRQDDLLSDFRDLAGQDILIFSRHGRDLAEYQPYFEKVTLREIQLDGKVYRLFLGHHFQYSQYRDRVLNGVLSNYYPWVCPFSSGKRCFFVGKYF